MAGERAGFPPGTTPKLKSVIVYGENNNKAWKVNKGWWADGMMVWWDDVEYKNVLNRCVDEWIWSLPHMMRCIYRERLAQTS